MILVVVGLPGSGKGVAAEVLRKKGFAVIELGDIWRKLAEKANIPLSDPLARTEFTERLREKYGKGIYGIYAARKAKKSMKSLVFIGFRSTYELNELRKKIKDITVIAIDAPFKIRFDRIRSRNKPEDPKTVEAFKEHENWERRGFLPDKSEEKYGVMRLINDADYIIRNVGTENDLREKIEKVLLKIVK